MRNTLITFVVAVLPSFAFAWGADGHRITGQIAEQYLTPEAAAAVADLLGDQTLADSTVWADSIKRDRPETRPWHYMNAPEGVEAVTLDHCPKRGCMLSKTIDFTAVLRDPDATRDEKIEALRFVTHFVGDIHTPLHMGLQSDKGGNDIRVEFQGSFVNLHSLWDSTILRSTRVKWPEYAERLTTEITEDDLETWSTLDPAAWATESYHLAHGAAYPIPESMRIEDDPDYRERALAIINQRLQQGGVRLAAILNDVFENQ